MKFNKMLEDIERRCNMQDNDDNDFVNVVINTSDITSLLGELLTEMSEYNTNEGDSLGINVLSIKEDKLQIRIGQNNFTISIVKQ